MLINMAFAFLVPSFVLRQAAVVVLGLLYACTVVFGFTVQFNSSSKGEQQQRKWESNDAAAVDHDNDGGGGGGGDDDDEEDARANAGNGTCAPVQKPYYERNIVGHWLDVALQYFVVGLCSNLQYIHLMQACWT